MILSEVELAEMLGVSPQELANGATWLQPARGGARVRASIIREDDAGEFFIEVSEEHPGDQHSRVAWLSGVVLGDTGSLEISGYENTGEFSESADPRAAAAVIRRQIEAIRRADDGRKVA